MLSVFVCEEEEALAALHNNTSRAEGEKIATGSGNGNSSADSLGRERTYTRASTAPRRTPSNCQ